MKGKASERERKFKDRLRFKIDSSETARKNVSIWSSCLFVCVSVYLVGHKIGNEICMQQNFYEKLNKSHTLFSCHLSHYSTSKKNYFKFLISFYEKL